MSKSTKFFWKDRIKASGLHFGISVVIAMLAAALVFGLWYPYPYREISGGRELFFLVVVVDVILGPLITFAVFNRDKSKAELARDLALVVLIQLGALGYGLWTVFEARPVHMVFEYDRFRVVHAVDVPDEMLELTPSGIDPLPITGPTLLSLREFWDAKEKMDATMAALQGVSLSARPDLWQPYEQAIPVILKAARPISLLKSRFAAQGEQIDDAVALTKRNPQEIVFVPMVGRKTFWTVLLDAKSAEILGYMPLDSF